MMAMARSLGKRQRHQNRCSSVDTKSVHTVAEEMNESATARLRVIHDVAT